MAGKWRLWLRRRLKRLRSDSSPVVLTGQAEWGAPYLIEGLGEGARPLVWLELTASDQGDPVAQGNKLAEAVARALGNPLFGYAMPYRYGLAVLKTHLDLLGPFTFALSSAAYGLELAGDLLSFQGGLNRVVLHFGELPPDFTLPERTLRLCFETLRLTEEEALDLAEGLSREAVRELLEETDGAYEAFLLALAEKHGFPPPLRPSPTGPQPLLRTALEPKGLLEILIRKERWLEALELAARHSPERVPELLERGRVKLWALGRHARLYRLLSALPKTVRQHGVVLSFWLSAALDLGREAEVLPEVEAHLVREEAPELRAIYAEVQRRLGNPEGYLEAAKRAVEARRNPLTLYQYGRALGTADPEAGLSHLQDALRLAEVQGELHWSVLAALGLSGRLVALGRYGEAASWAEWGLKLYDREGMGHTGLRLSLVNEWAYARVLAEETAGLEAQLRQEAEDLEEVRPALARLLRSTLGDVLLAEGRAQEALEVYESLWTMAKRRESYGAIANMHVRALLELGRFDEALELAERTMHLTEGLPLIYRRRAALAYGLALSLTEPDRAVAVLEALLPEFSEPLLAPQFAQAGLYLAHAQLALGDAGAAAKALAAVQVGLAGLGEGGLRYLAGPEELFRDVFALLERPRAPLELHFLGGIEVRYEGQRVKLRKRFADILTVLALHPAGVSTEQLALAVYGERTSLSGCRADLARLRRVVPFETSQLEVWADFIELPRLLSTGQVREALVLYRGPLLPGSAAPLVAEQRGVLEEALRQAVLASDDIEALLTLAERLEDDLEVWEAALKVLPESDPRRALALARVKRLSED